MPSWPSLNGEVGILYVGSINRQRGIGKEMGHGTTAEKGVSGVPACDLIVVFVVLARDKLAIYAVGEYPSAHRACKKALRRSSCEVAVVPCSLRQHLLWGGI